MEGKESTNDVGLNPALSLSTPFFFSPTNVHMSQSICMEDDLCDSFNGAAAFRKAGDESANIYQYSAY